MFGNNYNNPAASRQQSTNTRVTSWSCDYSCLSIKLWDDNLSLAFNICTGKDANGRNNYDFQNRITTAITPERAMETGNYLLQVRTQLEEFVKSGNFEPSNLAFDVGAKGNKLCFECSKDEQGQPSVYIRLYTNVNSAGQSSDCVTYKMNHHEYTKNYDPKVGNGERYVAHDELDLFIFYLTKLLKVAEYKFDHHAQRYMKMIDAQFAGGTNGAVPGGNGGFNNNAGGSYQAPMSAMSTGDDYPF